MDIPAPMTGIIKEILVAPGDTVAEGQELIIIESMKMEIPVEAPEAGTVGEIAVAVGAQIEENALLLRLA